MSSYALAAVTLGCVCAGVLLGMALRCVLPDHHVRDDSKDIVKTASGLIATLVALVLGLLVGSAKSSFDAINAGLTQASAKVIALHRLLVRYGPDAKDARGQLHGCVVTTVERIWPADGSPPVDKASVETSTGFEELHERIRTLPAQTDLQKQLQAQSVQISSDMLQLRWLLIVQTESTLPRPFFIILMFWLAVLYLSFGLLAPRNATALMALVVCAVSISGAIFLINEMNRPFDGAIRVSDAAFRKALEITGH